MLIAVTIVVCTSFIVSTLFFLSKKNTFIYSYSFVLLIRSYYLIINESSSDASSFFSSSTSSGVLET